MLNIVQLMIIILTSSAAASCDILLYFDLTQVALMLYIYEDDVLPINNIRCRSYIIYDTIIIIIMIHQKKETLRAPFLASSFLFKKIPDFADNKKWLI